MPVLIENSIAKYLGLKQQENPIVVKAGQGIEVYARILEALRPVGGMLQKVKGSDKLITINRKSGRQPMTLIRFNKNESAPLFIATIWDAIMLVADSGSSFNILNSSEEGVTTDGYVVPSNFPFLEGYDSAHLAGQHKTQFNTVWDWLIYDEILYLTDGINRPIKTDGTLLGEWGFHQIVGSTTMLLAVIQDAGGNLIDDTYKYKVSLYNSEKGLEGNLSTNILTQAANAQKLWIYGNFTQWTQDDNYDFKNEFADKIRIYRTPSVGGGGATEYFLSAELNNVAPNQGTVEIENDGTVTGTGTKFQEDKAAVGFAFIVADGDGGFDVYQISAVGGEDGDDAITLIDPDGTAYSGGVYAASSAYRILPGFIDNVNDISDEEQHFEEDFENFPEESDRQHDVPERCKYCTMMNERAFMTGDPNYPTRVYYSTIGLPDYFPVENFRDIAPDDGDPNTGIFVFEGRLYVSKRNSMAIFNVNEFAPFEWVTTSKYLSVGTPAKQLIVDCDGVLIFVNRAGVYAWGGGSLRNISHRENSSNIIDQWKKVVLSKLKDARVVYHEARNEFWFSCALNDERGLYDPSLVGLGTILENTTTVGIDDAPPPQNNGTFVYSLDTDQWHFNPYTGASAFSVWQGEGDENELFRGGKGAKIYREDSKEANDTAISDYGQATDGGTQELEDSGADWEDDEWNGGTVFVYHVSDGTSQDRPILDTVKSTKKISWTFPMSTAVAATDYYLILKESDDGTMELKWRTGMLVIGSFRELKEFFELLIRVFGSGTMNISWTLDGGETVGGLFQFAPEQGTGVWGDKWTATGDASQDPGELYWSELQEILKAFDFPVNEGKLIELEFTTETSQKLELTMLVLGYKIHRGNRWEP